MKGSNSIQPARLGRLLTAPKEGDAFEARNHDDDDDDDDDNNDFVDAFYLVDVFYQERMRIISSGAEEKFINKKK